MTKQEALTILEKKYQPLIDEKVVLIREQMRNLAVVEDNYNALMREYQNKKNQVERFFDAVELRSKIENDLNIDLDNIL